MQRVQLLIISLLMATCLTKDVRALRSKKGNASVSKIGLQLSQELRQAIENHDQVTVYERSLELIQAGCLRELESCYAAVYDVLDAEYQACLDQVLEREKTMQQPVGGALSPKYSELQKKYRTLKKDLVAKQKEYAREIKDLSMQLQNVEESLASRNKRVEQLELTLALSQEHQALPDTIVHLQEELAHAQDAAEKTKQRLHTANQSLEAALTKTQDELMFAQQEFAEVSKQVREYAEQVVAAEHQNNELCMQLAVVADESDTLQKQLQDSRQECHVYLTELQQVRNHLNESAVVYAEQKQVSQDLTEKLAQLMKDYQELSVEFREYQLKNNPDCVHDFMAQCKQVARERIEELLEHNKHLVQEKARLEHQFSQEREELVAECELHEEQLEHMWEQLKQERHKVMYVQHVKDDLIDQLKEKYDTEYELLSEKYDQLDEQYLLLMAQLDEQYASEDQLKNALAQSMDTTNALRNEMAQLQATHSESVAYINDLRHEKVMIEELYELLAKDNEQKKEHIVQLSDQLIEYQNLWHQNEKLHTYAEALEIEKSRFESQCKQLVSELDQQRKVAHVVEQKHGKAVAQLENRCEQYSMQLEETQRALDVAHGTIAQLSHEVQLQSQGILALQVDMADQKQAYDTQLLAAQQGLEAAVAEGATLASVVDTITHERDLILDEQKSTMSTLALAQETLESYVRAYQASQAHGEAVQQQAYEGLEKAMKMAEQKVCALYDQSQMLRTQLAQTQEQQRILQDQLGNKTSLSDQLLVELQSSKDQVIRLEQDVKLHETQASHLQKKLMLVEQVLHESAYNTLAEHEIAADTAMPA